MRLRAASEVIVPVALDKASDVLPVSEAAFEELRATNAELRASHASLAQANSESNDLLEAAEVKLKELFPVSSDTPRVLSIAPHGMHCAGGQVLQHDAFLNHAPDLERASKSYFITVLFCCPLSCQHLFMLSMCWSESILVCTV